MTSSISLNSYDSYGYSSGSGGIIIRLESSRFCSTLTLSLPYPRNIGCPARITASSFQNGKKITKPYSLTTMRYNGKLLLDRALQVVREACLYRIYLILRTFILLSSQDNVNA